MINFGELLKFATAYARHSLKLAMAFSQLAMRHHEAMLFRRMLTQLQHNYKAIILCNFLVTCDFSDWQSDHLEHLASLKNRSSLENRGV